MATGAERPLAQATVTRDGLDALAQDGHLDTETWRRARLVAGLSPDAARWQRLLEGTCTLGGALLLGTALIFFIAYNWNEMGRFARLGLIEAAVVVCAVAAIALKPRTLPGRAAILLGIIATGGLLAFVGQTYQTGADPWQLFAVWAALSIPWAIAAAWGPAWTVPLLCANLAIVLYIEEVLRPFGIRGETALFVSIGLFNVAAAAIAERWGPQGADGAFRLLPRTAVLLALAAATFGGIVFLFPWSQRSPALAVQLVGILAAAYWAYRVWRRDLLLLSAWALGGIVFIAACLVRMFDLVGDPVNWMMLIALAVVGLSAWAATWIRRVAREDA